MLDIALFLRWRADLREPTFAQSAEKAEDEAPDEAFAGGRARFFGRMASLRPMGSTVP